MHRKLPTALVALLLVLALAMPSALADSASGIIAQAAAKAESQYDDAAAEPTEQPTPDATARPAASARPSATARATATARPTEEPTEQPTEAPTEAPTAEPTEEPTPIPTLEPQPTATPLPLPMREDDRGELVKQVQTRLRELGFLNDTADGIFGPNTLKGVKAFQEFVSEFMGIDLHYVDPNATPEPTEEPTPEPTEAPTEEPTEQPSPTPTLAPGQTESPATAASTPEVAATPEAPTATPYLADGIVDEQGYELLTGDEFAVYLSDLEKGARGNDVRRLQTRLSTLYYLSDGIDGIFGSNTQSAVKYFQKYNDLDETGIADEQTQLKLYSADAVPTARPTLQPASASSKGNGKSYDKYKLVVDISDQRVYAYGYENGAYGPLARVMVCSTGTKSNPTPLGTFNSTERLGTWYYFKKYDCWAQYAYRITGAYYFHSVLFNSKGASKPTSSSVRNLGKRASHGCVRLSVEDAKWIYNNCSAGTTVVVRE